MYHDSETHTYIIDGTPITVEVDCLPRVCPRCHTAINAVPIHTKRTSNPHIGEGNLQIVFLCPACDRFFIAEYEDDDNFPEQPFILCDLVPKTFQPTGYTPMVHELSAEFVKLAAQAEEAEFYKLHDIAGPGYRKALEYLVKDYAILKNKSNEEQIKTQQLSTVINNYVQDPRIVECAKRATWLGNDEVHYVRVQTDHDISDLKILIQLTVHWIAMEKLTEDYGHNLQPKSRSTP